MAHIWLVEDEPLVRDALVDLLESEGHTVETAWCGDDALDVFKGNADVMVSDIRMPGHVNGRELARLMAERHPKMKVILMTAWEEELFAKPLEDKPPVLLKPFTFIKLTDAINLVMAQ